MAHLFRAFCVSVQYSILYICKSVCFCFYLDVVSLSVVATTPLRKYIQFRKLSIPDIHREEYNLNITGNRILVSARDSPGAFYGVQTIISLWNSTDGQIPVMFIKDKPR